MSADSSHQLNGSLIKAGSDSSFTEDFLTKFGVRDSKRKLLLLRRLGGWKMGGEEVF